MLVLMPDTSLTLLERLRHPNQPDAWARFVRLYAPLLLGWARGCGLQDADAEDLTQLVLVKLIRLLPAYRRADGGSFRRWLFTIARNEARDFRTRRPTRPLPPADGLATVAASAPEPDDGAYRHELAHRALELVRGDFEPRTWDAFERFVLRGEPAATVAADLGLTANAVYLARNRVLTRVRAELAGLFD
jgi:RNA polymerase sigma-70 factor (ECF subfamily)